MSCVCHVKAVCVGCLVYVMLKLSVCWMSCVYHIMLKLSVCWMSCVCHVKAECVLDVLCMSC